VRPLRLLPVGSGTHDLAERLRRAAPRIEIVLADDAASGERHLADVDAVIAGAPDGAGTSSASATRPFACTDATANSKGCRV
jgi:hypothetical protein